MLLEGKAVDSNTMCRKKHLVIEPKFSLNQLLTFF
jgi:hypothetical protein